MREATAAAAPPLAPLLPLDVAEPSMCSTSRYASTVGGRGGGENIMLREWDIPSREERS